MPLKWCWQCKQHKPIIKFYKNKSKKDGLRTECIECSKQDFLGREFSREKIRVRDNYTCQICGEKWDIGKRRLDVHHKDCDNNKSKQYDNYEKEKDNMITLCHRCHLNLPEHKLAMSNSKEKRWEEIRVTA